MSKKHDGGPAFPVSTGPEEVDGGYYGHQDGPFTYQFGGMTLRDYFAAKAMQALIGELSNTDQAVAEMERLGLGESQFDRLVAKCAYDYADAMLAARDTGKGGAA